MNLPLKTLAAAAFGAALATSATAATPFLPLANEPAPRLIVGTPAPEPLARSVVVIPYRTENIRILPVFGQAALNVSPRAGHLHVTVDGLPWHWADASDTNTVVVADLPPGPHKVLIELATPDHKVITGETVHFTVPAQTPAAASHGH